jgi:hypothetical protein
MDEKAIDALIYVGDGDLRRLDKCIAKRCNAEQEDNRGKHI